MIALKCKMCGGDIEITGEHAERSIGTCSSCGCAVTLPRIREERRIEMFNRGNHFRRIGEFDRAYSAYEHIIAEDRNDAEAHFCMTLCRFGVEYVQDARTGDYKPTISRMSYTPVWEDPDYQAAVSSSAQEAASLYRREAGRIAGIQERYLEIVKKEPPYDVFICFKAENADKTRTKGSVIAQDIYEEMTSQGLKVFFSRITLENKLSEEFEPYIFAALYSAKVMLVVANAPEQLNARWVKNEWCRFLLMMKEDSAKSMIPVFADMSPYDFPQEIPTVQGVDISRIGAVKDLVKNVMRLTGRQKAEPVVMEQISRSVVENIIRRVRHALEDEDYEEARTLAQKACQTDPKCGDAWYYLLLADEKVQRLEELMKDGRYDWPAMKEFQKAYQYSTGARKDELEDFQELCGKERRYQEAGRDKNEQQYKKAADEYQKLHGYRDSESLMEWCLNKLEELKKEQQAKEKLAERDALYKKIEKDPTGYMREQVKERFPADYRAYEELCAGRGEQVGPYHTGAAFGFMLIMLLGSLLLIMLELPAFKEMIAGVIPFVGNMNCLLGILGHPLVCFGAAGTLMVSSDMGETCDTGEHLSTAGVCAILLGGIFDLLFLFFWCLTEGNQFLLQRVIIWILAGIGVLYFAGELFQILRGRKWREGQRRVNQFIFTSLRPCCRTIEKELDVCFSEDKNRKKIWRDYKENLEL